MEKGLRSGSKDDTLNDHIMMKEMGWSWTDLYNTPETVVLSNLRIIGLKAKLEIQRQHEMEQESKRVVQ